MKNLLTIALVVFLAGAFTSCKKDYTCTCETTILGITTSDDTEIMDASKSDADDICDGLQTAAQAAALFLGGTASCSLN